MHYSPLSLAYPRARGAYLTHPGRIRRDNEDAVLFGAAEAASCMEQPAAGIHDGHAPWLVAVADGIGGHLAGERASQEVIAMLGKCSEITPDGVSKALCEINRRLHKMGQEDRNLAGMGATVAGLACGAEGIFAFNVGDARVYRQQDQFLRRITRDDSVAELLADAAGENGPVNGHRYALHVLTQSLGGSSQYREIDPHIYPLTVCDASRFLLCSDGLSDTLSLDVLERTVCEAEEPDVLAAGLLQRSLREEARDNVTLIVVDIEP